MAEGALVAIAKMVAAGSSVLGPDTNVYRVRILWRYRLNKIHNQLETQDLSEINSKDVLLVMIHLGVAYLFKRNQEAMAKSSLEGIISLVDYLAQENKNEL